MSTHVMALTLLLADGSRVTCSRNVNQDLFVASICGLGSTGLILSIQLQVEPAFRLREVQETFDFQHVMQELDRFVFAAEHVRFWWFPMTGTVRVSSSDRTHEVRSIPMGHSRFITQDDHPQPRRPASSWLWHSFMGHHVIQFLLFMGRYFLFLNYWIGCFAAWLIRDKTIGVDDSHRIFNVDCRVSLLLLAFSAAPSSHFSTRNIPSNGLSHMTKPRPACARCMHGMMQNTQIHRVFDRTFRWRFVFRQPTTFG